MKQSLSLSLSCVLKQSASFTGLESERVPTRQSAVGLGSAAFFVVAAAAAEVEAAGCLAAFLGLVGLREPRFLPPPGVLLSLGFLAVLVDGLGADCCFLGAAF